MAGRRIFGENGAERTNGLVKHSLQLTRGPFARVFGGINFEK